VHIAEAGVWAEAVNRGTYEPASLAREGFVHCSTPWQAVRIGNLNFAGRPDLVLLIIDPSKLGAATVFENCEGRIEPFPHIYGPVPIEAVERAEPLRWVEGRLSFEFPDGWQLD
jgi:uncharacterized protein (DUF952 family)